MRHFYFAIALACLSGCSTLTTSKDPLVIAHRGASGYLPDHTLPAKAFAYAQGADYLEQDLVMSKDNVLVVCHDLYLNNISDVATQFPNRARADGKYYVIDFTWHELQSLNMSSPFTMQNGQQRAKYAGRFPLNQSRFKLHTFAQEIEFIQGLNHSTGKNIGIYPEIKAPWFHTQHNKDIAKAALTVLKQYGYTQKQHKVYLQSFDPHALKYIKSTLMPSMNIDIKLVQLVAQTNWQETQEQVNGQWQNLSYNTMLTPEGIAQVAQYADGLGPWYKQLISIEGKQVTTKPEIVAHAHKHGLQVHPYTFRADDTPKSVGSYSALISLFTNELNIDGFFTDFTDQTIQQLNKHKE